MNNFLKVLLLIFCYGAVAQSSVITPNSEQKKIVVITGVRFAYPLIQKWIDEYTLSHPESQIIIEWRGAADPKADIIVEAYEHDSTIKQTREYLYVANYAILPVANQNSSFAKFFSAKGLTNDLISQVYFHDPFNNSDENKLSIPYTVYTRLQKAGAPIVFTRHFGFDQKDIRGKAIAGSDEHLMKAVLRDSLGVSYLPLTLIFDHDSQKPLDGLTILPIDLNGNNKVSESEKNINNLNDLIALVENSNPKEIKNLPSASIHLSISKEDQSAEALDFMFWVLQNGVKDLHKFGYLLPTNKQSENKHFEEFALMHLQ